MHNNLNSINNIDNTTNNTNMHNPSLGTSNLSMNNIAITNPSIYPIANVNNNLSNSNILNNANN